MDGGLQHNRTPASSCSSERGVSLVTGAMMRLLFTLRYCFIISCLWDLGQIHSIIRIICFSEFQQTSNLQPASSGMWGLGRKRSFNTVIWDIQPRVQRGLARRSRSPVVPVYDPDAHPIPQRLAVSTVLAEKTLEDLLLVPFFIAQVKGEGKTC